MGKIRVRVKAPFGEIEIEGENAQEILKTLKMMPPQFVNEVGNLISSNLTPSLQPQLDGIIEVTEASEALQRNTLVRVFSKDEDKLKKKEERKQQRNSN